MGSSRRTVKKIAKSTRTNFVASKMFQSFYGIGKTKALRLCALFGVRPTCSQDAMDQLYKRSLLQLMETFYNDIWGDTLSTKLKNISRKIKLKTYQGARHLAGLPVRGQGTHTNAKTRRKRKVV